MISLRIGILATCLSTLACVDMAPGAIELGELEPLNPPLGEGSLWPKLSTHGVVALIGDWENIGDMTTSYAGFNAQGDRSLRSKLRMEPGSVTIMADSDIHHRGGIVYMTADGMTHRISREQIEDLGIEYGPGAVEVGPGSEFEELRTVTND